MANRIICLCRPAVKGDEFLPVPELRLIDPGTSATHHGHVPTSDEDVQLLIEWLQENLPAATWRDFKGEMHKLVSYGIC